MITNSFTKLFLTSFFLPIYLFAQSPQVHQDRVFLQDYAIKYPGKIEVKERFSLAVDRNGTVQILEKVKLLRPAFGAFQQDGKLVADQTYLPMKDKTILAILSYQDQLVYLDEKAVLSNAWAGDLYLMHDLKNPHALAGGKDMDFVAVSPSQLQYLKKGQKTNPITIREPILDIRFDAKRNRFLLLQSSGISAYSPGGTQISQVAKGEKLSAFALDSQKDLVVIGTENGYFTLDLANNQAGTLQTKLPWTEITAVEVNGTDYWFGSKKGAFRLDQNGTFSYYFGDRWLSGEQVRDMALDKNRVHILTEKGLSTLVFEEMTLAKKAEILEDQVRKMHIRNGFNASLQLSEKGNLSSGRLKDSDNDGLWTSMYLGGQAFRYAVTKDPEALANCKESLLAMERLYTINPIEGFPSRSFERSGYIEQLSDPDRWQHATDPEWDWKATTSSDEAIGHVFAFSVLAEIVDDPWIKAKSIELLDALMSHIIRNDMYLIDYDGKPTLWGKWHPDYVNGFPEQVGDRKLNSSNIIAMLQTAFHFTGKEIYKEKAYELMEKHGYLENLMRPMAIIGQASDGSDDWSKMLSESWNHSDDEMYFLGYWGLYRYAFTPELKVQFKKSILDHWEAERPEKEALWNIFTALVQPENFDLKESIWFLEKHPIDLIGWQTQNSHRQDITTIPDNFRRQSTETVLSPSETRIMKHNGNRFTLDGGSQGTTVYSAGDIWLLPYWMGKYLQVIR
jgi:hemin uptake protein HemP